MITQTPVLTVSQLNRQVRSWLEHEMGRVRVEGEISNLSKPASGHLYFTLKDATAQLRCVYFRNQPGFLGNPPPENGQKIQAHGHLSLYEARGDYQLIVEQIQLAGEGDLYRQFEVLKAKLDALGWFDPKHKKPLPRFPHRIGVITSASGAALRDILTTLARRFPIAQVIVYATDVQGKQAAPQLIQAIHIANHDKRCEVLILARGGGSIEDLWAFNEERLAHAIFNSRLPIVSGVGHETDFTITDFVADLRAATPTAAAEAVSPNAADLMVFFQTIENQLHRSMSRFIKHQQLLLQHQLQKITSPKQLIGNYWQFLDYLTAHLHRVMQQSISEKKHLVHLTVAQLKAKHPSVLLKQARVQLQQLEHQLLQQIKLKITHLKQQITTQLATLQAISPLATLERGYAIITLKNKVVLNPQQVTEKDVIDVRLSTGHITASVLNTKD